MGAVLNSSAANLKETNPEEDEAADLISALTYDNQNPHRTSIGGPETSPFLLEKWEPGKYAKVVFNGQSREGRPYVDAIEIKIGRTAQDRLVGLELGEVDLTKIPPELARRAADRGVRVSMSRPDELLALVFQAGRTATDDARVREALAASIDRASISNFILQKNGEAAGGLLPQWMSGTAFLFSTTADTARVKEIRAQITGSPKLVLGYDSDDPLEQSVAGRIVVNAQGAGISLTAQAMPGPGPAAMTQAAFDARLIRLRMPSPLPRAVLMNFLEALGSVAKIDASPLPDPASPQEIYDRERAVVSSYRVVPLVWLPQIYGLSARVRDWRAPGPGETWPLADVWLDGPAEPVNEKTNQ
jgi:ABC-type transport system substrate-binding protein